MSFRQKALNEIKSIGLLAAYLAAWFSLLMLLKRLKALITVFQHRDMPHDWAGTICVGGSVLGFMVLSAPQRYFGAAELRRLLFATPLADLEAKETMRGGASPDREIKPNR